MTAELEAAAARSIERLDPTQGLDEERGDALKLLARALSLLEQVDAERVGHLERTRELSVELGRLTARYEELQRRATGLEEQVEAESVRRARLRRKAARLRRAKRHLRRRLRRRVAELEAVRRSRSWRLTRPLRAVTSLFRRRGAA